MIIVEIPMHQFSFDYDNSTISSNLICRSRCCFSYLLNQIQRLVPYTTFLFCLVPRGVSQHHTGPGPDQAPHRGSRRPVHTVRRHTAVVPAQQQPRQRQAKVDRQLTIDLSYSNSRTWKFEHWTSLFLLRKIDIVNTVIFYVCFKRRQPHTEIQ